MPDEPRAETVGSLLRAEDIAAAGGQARASRPDRAPHLARPEHRFLFRLKFAQASPFVPSADG
jgi:hypothetical protein